MDSGTLAVFERIGMDNTVAFTFVSIHMEVKAIVYRAGLTPAVNAAQYSLIVKVKVKVDSQCFKVIVDGGKVECT